jgi:signal transduction histidine kinase
MSGNDYLIAWVAYGIAAFGILLVWFRLTGWLWRWLREPLRLFAAILLFTPTVVDASQDLFAPAIAVAALDMLFKVGNSVWRAVADLAMYGMIAFALYLLFAAIRWPIERRLAARRAQREAQQQDERTLAERMQDEPAAFETPRRPRADRLRVEPRL